MKHIEDFDGYSLIQFTDQFNFILSIYISADKVTFQGSLVNRH